MSWEHSGVVCHGRLVHERDSVAGSEGRLADGMVPRHTTEYIGNDTEGLPDLVPGGVEALGSAVRSFTSTVTNKWRCPCEMSEEAPGTPTAVVCNRDSIPRGGAGESGQGWPGPIPPRTASEHGWFARHEYRDFPIRFQILLPIRWLRVLSGRELRRIGRVSRFVSLPTHRSRGMSVMRPWRTPAGLRTAQ